MKAPFYIWPQKGTYGDVINNYFSHVLSKYGKNTTVVFDGHPEESTTKGEEKARRSAKNSSSNIEFYRNTKCITKQQAFLANKKNKRRLIQLVSIYLRDLAIPSVIAEADADLNIVK